MKFRKLFMVTAIGLALTASFAFKAEKRQYEQSTYWGSLGECNLDIVDDACARYNTGPQCTGINSGLPQYRYDSGPTCTTPLYEPF
jgi:hypothetical protein